MKIKENDNFHIWETMNPDTFLSNDRDNPARSFVASVISGEAAKARRALSVIEIGPGNGIDYGDHFRPLIKKNKIKYSAFDGCKEFVKYLTKKYPEMDISVGTFSDLQGKTADIVYIKALLEHQPHFEEPLRAMLRASKRLCIVNWYLPPGDKEDLKQNLSEQTHTNRYAKSDVERVVAEEGFTLIIENMPEPASSGNAIYVMRKK